MYFSQLCMLTGTPLINCLQSCLTQYLCLWFIYHDWSVWQKARCWRSLKEKQSSSVHTVSLVDGGELWKHTHCLRQSARGKITLPRMFHMERERERYSSISVLITVQIKTFLSSGLLGSTVFIHTQWTHYPQQAAIEDHTSLNRPLSDALLLVSKRLFL